MISAMHSGNNVCKWTPWSVKEGSKKWQEIHFVN